MMCWSRLFAFLLILCAWSYAAEGNNQSSRRLARIADEYWQHQLQTEPYYKLQRGETINDLPDISERGAKAGGAFARHLLRELAAVKPGELDHQDWLTLEILRWRVRQDGMVKILLAEISDLSRLFRDFDRGGGFHWASIPQPG